MTDKICLYTDGAAKGNPGPGGYGIVLQYKGNTKEFFRGFRHTTNNRMELLAVIDGLKQLKTKSIPVAIFSDSKYVIDAISKGWIYNWQKKNFKDKANKDLWLEYISICKDFQIELNWVKGHAGHPQNERCDELAVFGSNLKEQEVDVWYENSKLEKEASDLF